MSCSPRLPVCSGHHPGLQGRHRLSDERLMRARARCTPCAPASPPAHPAVMLGRGGGWPGGATACGASWSGQPLGSVNRRSTIRQLGAAAVRATGCGPAAQRGERRRRWASATVSTRGTHTACSSTFLSSAQRGTLWHPTLYPFAPLLPCAPRCIRGAQPCGHPTPTDPAPCRLLRPIPIQAPSYSSNVRPMRLDGGACAPGRIWWRTASGATARCSAAHRCVASGLGLSCIIMHCWRPLCVERGP